jgi:Fur family ferric uptake transcriptional regulator
MISTDLEKSCQQKGLRMTDQRRIIVRVLSESQDHPDVEAVFRRATTIDPKISLATVYRTLRLLEEANILSRHDFGDGKSRYEEASCQHHHHLIDTRTSHIIEFHNERIESILKEIARDLGYQLVGHRLELYGVPLKGNEVEQHDT